MNHSGPNGRRLPGPVEFTALLAMSMALAALGIDLMLPAFGAIRADLGLRPDSTAAAGLITTYFVGLATGQLFYGPLADRFGRRPVLYAGYAIYGIGALMAALSPTLPLLLASRLLWGIGAAGPRVVTLAVIRDSFEGERMSRAMSFVMAIFIVVPVLAPSIGAAVVAVASWRWLFGGCMLAVSVMALWAARLPETLHSEHRTSLRLGSIATAARFVVSDRQTVTYTLAMTALYGAFSSYLASSEIIFGSTFGRGSSFPLIFGGLALAMGGAMLVNARIVGRVGTRRLAHSVLLAYVTIAAVLAAVAGTASAVIGATQIALGAALGAVLDRAFDGTVRPLVFGFLFYGAVALVLVVWAERGRLFGPLADAPPLPVAETAPAPGP